jgi:hypothetical protein
MPERDSSGDIGLYHLAELVEENSQIFERDPQNFGQKRVIDACLFLHGGR